MTFANSKIIATFHIGMPRERVSVYYDDKNQKLTMTHYCAVANQPKLVLTELGNNKMTEQWTSYAEGKKAQVVKVALLEANQTNSAPDETRQ